MIEAAANIPWVPSREADAGVARHLGCTPEDAELQIVGKAKAGRIKTRGVIENRPVSLQIVGEGEGSRIKAPGATENRLVSPLPVAWNGTIDLAGATLKPPEVSYEITNLELCFIDLIAEGLLPAPAEKARWPAAEAIAYLVKGVPLPWAAWQTAGVPWAEIEQAEIDLGEVIRAGVPAWGWHPLERKRKRIPADHFRDEMIENKAPLPIPEARRPKVVVHIDGNVGTSPLYRIADYGGPRWEAIEVDSAALRRACPRPLKAQAEPARAEPTRGKRDPVIVAMKELLPPHGLRPKGMSIKRLTNRINKLPGFEENKVSEDTVRLADIEIRKAAPKK